MDDQCETCGGDRVLVGDGVDGRGREVDVVEQCPDCASGDYDDRDYADGGRECDVDAYHDGLLDQRERIGSVL
jgi:hypothetical protein